MDDFEDDRVKKLRRNTRLGVHVREKVRGAIKEFDGAPNTEETQVKIMGAAKKALDYSARPSVVGEGRPCNASGCSLRAFHAIRLEGAGALAYFFCSDHWNTVNHGNPPVKLMSERIQVMVKPS